MFSFDINAMFWQYGLLLALGFAILSAASAFIASYSRLKGRTWGSFYFIGLCSLLLSGTITASMTEAPHPDECVICPTCTERVRYSAKKCGVCQQPLTPNVAIGQDIIARAVLITQRLKLASYIVTGAGALFVIIASLQSDMDKLTHLQWTFLPWIVFGIGISMLVMPWIRQRYIVQLAAQVPQAEGQTAI